MTSSPESAPGWVPPDLDAGIRPGLRFKPAQDLAPAPGRALSATLTDSGEPATEEALALPEFKGGFVSSDPAAGAEAARSELGEAYDLGFADGLRAGSESAEQRIRPALETVARITEALDSARIEFEHNREQDLVALALAVARKLVHREITADPGVVRDLVARALELMPADPAFEVRLHPADFAVIGRDLESIFPAGRPQVIQWIADASLQRGSFVIESPLRVVDGRTDTALRTLYDRFGHD
jgi:flagellar assembly protein FliH